MGHKRFFSTSFKICCEDCPKDGTPLKIILFLRDEYLRSHTIRHFIIKEEEIKIWGKLSPSIGAEIDNCRKALYALGCPSLTKSMEVPPCLIKKEGGSIRKERCRYYDRCTDFVKNLESEYLEIARKTIIRGGNIPLYACYTEKDKIEKDKKASSLCILSDQMVAAKAFYLNNDNIYNLATCYAPKPVSHFQEVRDYTRRKIYKEALDKPSLCTHEAWDPWFFSFKEVFERAGIIKIENTNHE